MLYKFEKVIDGISRYIDAEIYSNMNDLQEIIARIAVGRIIGNENNIKTSLVNNGIIRTFGIIDGDGMVDVEKLICEIKEAMQKKGKVEISIPMFGKMTFRPEDMDEIHKFIQMEDQYR